MLQKGALVTAADAEVPERVHTRRRRRAPLLGRREGHKATVLARRRRLRSVRRAALPAAETGLTQTRPLVRETRHTTFNEQPHAACIGCTLSKTDRQIRVKLCNIAISIDIQSTRGLLSIRVRRLVQVHVQVHASPQIRRLPLRCALGNLSKRPLQMLSAAVEPSRPTVNPRQARRREHTPKHLQVPPTSSLLNVEPTGWPLLMAPSSF